MGYLVIKRKDLKVNWAVQFVSHVNNKQVRKNLPKENWNSLGFHPGMTFEEARLRSQQINSVDKVAKIEQKRMNIISRFKEEDEIISAFLPKHDIVDFETNFLFNRLHLDTIRRNNLECHWRAAKRTLFEVKLEPAFWYDNRTKFYDHFSKCKISPSYVQKILRMINNWGMFFSRKYKQPFFSIPSPVGVERERIADSYFSKNLTGKESDGISPNHLLAHKFNLSTEHYNWLYLSVWFGLRPSEVDILLTPSGKMSWYITSQNNVDILWIYQKKLTSISRDRRVKPIPCIYPEQKEGLDIIKSQAFRRPLGKTIRRHLKGKFTLYGGRKGFTDLMLSKGQSLENISTWLGHSSIERTWKSYKNKQIIMYKEAG